MCTKDKTQNSAYERFQDSLFLFEAGETPQHNFFDSPYSYTFPNRGEIIFTSISNDNGEIIDLEIEHKPGEYYIVSFPFLEYDRQWTDVPALFEWTNEGIRFKNGLELVLVELYDNPGNAVFVEKRETKNEDKQK